MQFLRGQAIAHCMHNSIDAAKLRIAVLGKGFLYPLAAKTGGFCDPAHALNATNHTQRR